jgi:holliday junction DNA helicase RuvA
VIASIRGLLSAKSTSHVVVDVHGVGYLINVTANTAAKLTIGEEVYFHTAMIVREDAMNLYGFNSPLEQELFDLLRSVTGVGPKSALAILGSLTTAEIASAVARDNDAAFKTVSGIGPKTAKLITVTLTGKLGHLVLDGPATSTSEVSYESVTAALASLGWPEKIAAEAVKEVSATAKPGEGRDVILRLALARLGSNKSNVSSLG